VDSGQAVCLTRSREGAKGNAKGKAEGTDLNEGDPCCVRPGPLCDSVARAFQPEPGAGNFDGFEWWVLRATGPLTPDPSPPFHGGEGRKSGQCSKSLPHAKPRSREGKRKVISKGTDFNEGDSCCVRPGPLCDFVARAFQPEPGAGDFDGVEWWVFRVSAPSPPTPLPRFTGARGGRVVSVRKVCLTRSREGKSEGKRKGKSGGDGFERG